MKMVVMVRMLELIIMSEYPVLRVDFLCFV